MGIIPDFSPDSNRAFLGLQNHQVFLHFVHSEYMYRCESLKLIDKVSVLCSVRDFLQNNEETRRSILVKCPRSLSTNKG